MNPAFSRNVNHTVYLAPPGAWNTAFIPFLRVDAANVIALKISIKPAQRAPAKRMLRRLKRERSWRLQRSRQCEFSFRYKPLLVSPQEIDPHDDGGHSNYAYNNSNTVTRPVDQASEEKEQVPNY